jgi:hypothetical protein
MGSHVPKQNTETAILERATESDDEITLDVAKCGTPLHEILRRTGGSLVTWHIASIIWLGALATSVSGQQPSAVNVHGRVVDSSGRPVRIAVSFSGLTLGYLGLTLTQPDGSYRFAVPKEDQYIVSLSPFPSAISGNYSFPSGYLPQQEVLLNTGGDVQADFTVTPAGTLWLRAYDQNGQAMGWADLLDPA